MTKRKIEYGVIPPDADGAFVANMEEVLETYEKGYDPDCPPSGEPMARVLPSGAKAK
jgi:hypothetical protein